ncbi:MAG: hypothetical protein ACR2NP_08020 [Pirellulaceae bacterium]
MAEQKIETTHHVDRPGLAWVTGVALLWTSMGLLMSLLLAGLVMNGVVDVPWDSKRLPLVMIVVLIPYCIIGFVISCISFYLRRDMRSIIAITLGVLAASASIVALIVINVAAVAAHPV